MPEEPEDVAVIARLMGFADYDSFATRYRAALNQVMSYYAELFAEGETPRRRRGQPRLHRQRRRSGDARDAGEARLRRSGRGVGDRAQVALWRLPRDACVGRARASHRAAAAAAEDHRRAPATPTRRWRGSTISSARLPGGVQLFALLRQHEQLRRLLVAFMASAPRMAEAVIHRTHVMDGLIDPAFADEVSRRRLLVAQGRRLPRRGAGLPGGHRPGPHHRAGAAVPDRARVCSRAPSRRRGQGSSSPGLPRRCSTGCSIRCGASSRRGTASCPARRRRCSASARWRAAR